MNIFKHLVALWIWLVLVVFASSTSFAYDSRCRASESYDDTVKAIPGYDGATVFAANECGCHMVGIHTAFINFSKLLAADTGLPQFIFRTGSQTDVQLTEAGGVSFRDSVSSAANGGQTFSSGDKIWAVDTSQLPSGTVVSDGGTVVDGEIMPPGHVSVTATADQIRGATVPVGPNNPLSGLARPVTGSPYGYKVP